MGTVIQLNPQHRSAALPTAGEALPPCEIVIFPGVRIERGETLLVAETEPPVTSGSADHGHRPRKSS